MQNKIIIAILLIAVTWLYLCKFLERSPDWTNAEITMSAVPGLQKDIEKLTSRLERLEHKPESNSATAMQWEHANRLSALEAKLVELEAATELLLRQAQRTPKDPLLEPLLEPDGRRNVPEEEENE